MSERVIKVLPGEGCHPEFAPEIELQIGMECDGYFLMAFNNDGENIFSAVDNVSIDFIQKAIVKGWEEGHNDTNIIRQAVAIADGTIRAIQLEKELKEMQMIQVRKNIVDRILGKEVPEDG